MEDIKPGLEGDLFTWKSWDQVDTMIIQFYDITLTRDIGPFKKGEQLAGACLDFKNSILELYAEEEMEHSEKFKLGLVIK